MTKEISETINFIWVVAKTAADKCQKQKQKLLMKLLAHSPRRRQQLGPVDMAAWRFVLVGRSKGRGRGRGWGESGCHKRL